MPLPVENFAKDLAQGTAGPALDAPAFHRNKEALLKALAPHLTERTGSLLEIGSGTGQHACTFAAAFPGLTYQPTDIHDEHIASVEAWRQSGDYPNLTPAVRLDALASEWHADVPDLAAKSLTALLAINVIHISPWAVAEAIFTGAGNYLAEDGLLITYGPYKRNGEHTSEGNLKFDASLKKLNPDFGVRDIVDVKAAAERAHLELAEEIQMPANNLTLIFKRRG